MTEDLTEIDRAHAAMEAAPDDDALRLRYYERLADSEVFLLLDREPEGEDIAPALFPVDGENFVLVFDREARLAEFAGGVAPYAALSGRGLVQMLVGQGIGIAVNPEVAPSAYLIPAAAVDWLAGTLSHGPTEAEARAVEVLPPRGIPEAVIEGLDRKLATAAGLARFVWLAGVAYEGGAKGHVVAFVDAVPGAEPALAAAVNEALTFSGVEAGALDVIFLRAPDAITAQLARVGLRFDLPEPAVSAAPKAPGMDPDKPPRLR